MTDLAAWGIESGYHDFAGQWRSAPDATVAAVQAAMGAREDGVGPDPAADRVLVVRAGDSSALPEGEWRFEAEDGGEVIVTGGLPRELGPGYYDLAREQDGRRIRLIVSPGRCHLPPDLHTWGWAVQLYAARSAASWGMGDLADLARLGRWSAGQGAGMALVNPLHAASPVGPQQASPYSPSSRCYRSPLYLRVEDVAGASSLAADLDSLAVAGRALNADRRIDRDQVWKLKLAALELLWERFPGDDDFDRYCEAQGAALAGYATFCALAEVHGSAFPSWPVELRHPESPAVLAFVDARHRRIRFHQWLQWLLDQQMAVAGSAIDLVTDLAIGVDPEGADAWLWGDCLATGMRVGAPPDEFATQGQDWGLPPFDPGRLRAAAYEPFIRMLRNAFEHSGGLRVDHVMGLFRLFWIPEGARPAEGTYVRYPWRELLDIVALESWRADSWVVGEDLGTVEPWVRDELAERGVLSYRLLWFEDGPPAHYPAQALAAVTTHDLPTVAGLWSWDDVGEQDELGIDPNLEATEAIRVRLGAATGLADEAPVSQVVVAAHRLLAATPSMVVVATLDDGLCVAERPNMPGVAAERRPNWSLALPGSIEEIEVDPVVAAVAAALAESRPPRPHTGPS